MAIAVFEIKQLIQEERPRILGKHLSRDEASQKNYGIIRGEPGYYTDGWIPWDDIFVAACPPSPHQVGLHPDPARRTLVRGWDYFQFPSTSGMFSQRAINLLMPYLEHCFVPLPSTVEGEPYYFLHTKDTIDALNVQESDIEYSETRIIWINKYRFYKDRLDDPVIFSIPQFRPFLFATESMPKIVEAAGLKGFDFRLIDGEDPIPVSVKAKN